MSDEKKKADAAAEQIFLPNETNINFLGHEIRMKPVPISVAKELRRLPEKLAKAMKATVGEDVETEAFTARDYTATELYIDIVYRLLQHYKINIIREDLEVKTTLTELKRFIETQIRVQGEEDFLFEPLRRSMGIFFPTPEEKEAPNQ